jgi:hypothetical protein
VESAPGQNLIASIVDVTASAGPFAIILPDATQASTGQTILFNNVGSNAFVVEDADGVQVLSVCNAGTTWQIYLTDNTTEAGTWRAFQYGASASSANASALAGAGIIAIGATLAQAYPTSGFNSNYTAGVADRATTFIWGGGAGTLGPSFRCHGCQITGSYNCETRVQVRWSIDPAGSETINGLTTTLSFNPGVTLLLL